MASLEVSSPDRCLLCNTPWGIPNPSGIFESRAMLPCGYIAGHDCLFRYLSSGPQDGDVSDPRRCVHCGQELWYSECKHTIHPHLVRVIPGPLLISCCAARTPDIVRNTAEMPKNCRQCAHALEKNTRDQTAQLLAGLDVERKACFRALLEASSHSVEREERVDRATADLVACQDEIEKVVAADALMDMSNATRRGW